YGTSYFVNPRGEFVAAGSEDADELIVADLDLSLIDEVRSTWQFFRDRRPEAYGELTKTWASGAIDGELHLDPRGHPGQRRRAVAGRSARRGRAHRCHWGDQRRGREPRRSGWGRDFGRWWGLRDARRHRSPHPHGAALHGHGRVRGLLLGHLGGGGRRDHDDPRLRDPSPGRAAAGRVSQVAGLGGQGRDRLLLSRRGDLVGRQR